MKRKGLLFTAGALAFFISLAQGGVARATAPRFGPKLITQEETLKVVSYQYAPLVDSQNPGYGMAAAIVQAALQEANLSVEIEVLPVRSLAKRSVLYDGAPALLASPSIFAKEELSRLAVLPCLAVRQHYYFYEPAHRELLSFGGDLKSLKGYRLGTVKGEEPLKTPPGLKVTSDDPRTLLKKLKERELDLVLLPEPVQRETAKKFPREEGLFRPLAAAAESLPFCLIVNEKDPRGARLRDGYRRGLERIRENGKYAEIVAAYGAPGGRTPETYRPVAPKGVIEFGSSETPPFYSVELPGDGMAGEIVRAIFDELHLESVIRYFPLKRLYTDHQNNHLGDPENFAGQRFSAIVPVAVYRPAFFYYRPRHPKGIRFRAPQDLKGYRIGVLRGTLENREYFERNAITVTEADNEQSLLRQLKEGRIDLCGLIRESGEYTARRFFAREADRFVPLEIPRAHGPIAIMISADYPEGAKLGERAGEALARLIRNGTYQRILTRYYGAGKIPPEWFAELERFKVRYQQGGSTRSP